MNLIKQFLIRALGFFARKIAGIGQRLELGPRASSYFAWVRDRGDTTLRITYPLGAEDVVWDVGAFRGDWADAIARQYGSVIHLFEPLPHLQERLRWRFRKDDNSFLHTYALGRYTGFINFTVSDDSSSAFLGNSKESIAVSIRDVVAVWEELGRKPVALLKVNIEGGEYDLLDRLVEAKLITQFQFLQIQFHDFVPGAQEKRKRIRKLLAETHSEIWCYPWVWESWVRKA